MVRVVLCSDKAWERWEELEKVEGVWVGVLSIVEIMREVSVAAEAEAEAEEDWRMKWDDLVVVWGEER